jgi:starvation-inducible DNA-binding protein
MNNMNAIGLNIETSKNLANSLNELLANFQLYYQNLRSFHWNIKGEKFFELHTKFEELYTAANLHIDELAERVLTLGFKPLSSFSEYIQYSEIKEASNLEHANEIIPNILTSLNIILVKERNALLISNEANDEGTNALLSSYIVEHEKLVWMLTAYNK